MIGRFTLALVASASMLPLAAQAQEVTQSDEIVVTASKREELLREVPQSVTAITAESLERLQASNFDDYVGHVPSLSVTSSQRGQSRLTLRGLNTGGVASTVGIYVDETPFGSSTGLVEAGVLALDLDPSDVQRIEVLRGPQGTLYGAGTLGGLVKFVTVAPQLGEFSGSLNGALESTEDGDAGYSARGLLNIPLGDRAAVRLSALSRSEGGFLDDPDRGVDDINGVDTFGWRASLLLKPTEDLSIRLSAQGQDIESEAINGVAYYADPLEPVAGDLDHFSPYSEYNDVSYQISNLTVDWDLGGASLVSSTSYSDLEQDHVNDSSIPYSGFLGPVSYVREIIPQDKFTQEVRLTSNGEAQLEWLVGAFFTRETGLLNQQIYTGAPPGANTTLYVTLASEYEERALFGGFTYHFTPQFDVAVGVRGSENVQESSQASNAGAPSGDQDSTDSAFTYSIAPRWRLSDDTMLYARLATGYRPGGPNVLAPSADIPATFEPDQTTNYELGVKTDLIDGLLRLDAAVYRIDWSDIQILVTDGIFAGNGNGEGAQSQGFEWTATLTPSDALTLVWSGAYTDAQLTDDTNFLVGGVDGDALPYTPEWATTVDANYEWAISGDAVANIGGAYRWVGEQANGFSADADRVDLPSYGILDLRAGVDFDAFSIQLYAKNATDERAITAFGGIGTTFPNLPPPDGPNGSATVVRPRTVGISLTTRF